MKKIFILLFVILLVSSSSSICYCATVGNPLDVDIPARSVALRQEVIEGTLDEYEQAVKIKISYDAEFLFEKEYHTTWEVTKAEMEGQWYMVKLGTTILSRIEPYVKLGTSNLEIKWRQNNTQNVIVDADSGFAWGGGIKADIWDFEDSGIRLTGDVQYRKTEPDIQEYTIDGTSVKGIGGDFEVEEWQIALLLSKKFELPLKWQNIYIVPYIGVSVSDSNVNVDFKNPSNTNFDYSLFDANNDNVPGFLLGCDILPSLRSSFSYSVEARLINELALSLGGTVKF